MGKKEEKSHGRGFVTCNIPLYMCPKCPGSKEMITQSSQYSQRIALAGCPECAGRVSKMLSEQPETMGTMGRMGTYGACTRVSKMSKKQENDNPVFPVFPVFPSSQTSQYSRHTVQDWCPEWPIGHMRPISPIGRISTKRVMRAVCPKCPEWLIYWH